MTPGGGEEETRNLKNFEKDLKEIFFPLTITFVTPRGDGFQYICGMVCWIFCKI